MSDTRSILERGIELWNAHDREGWVGLFDEEADLEAPGGIQVRGRLGAELFYDTWNEAFPDNSIADAVVFGAGEQGAEEARFAGTHTGVLHTPNGDIPPTGKNVVSRYAAVCPGAGRQGHVVPHVLRRRRGPGTARTHGLRQ